MSCIAVAGATGNVGGELVDLAAGAGHDVRALSSRGTEVEGARPFAVDLGEGPTLDEALTGADAAFLLAGYDDAGIVAALERAGVRRVALLSSGAVPTASEGNAVAAYHRASESALAQSSLEWTVLRPNTFFANTLRWADAIRSGKPVVAPFADVPIAANDPRDIAAVALEALESGAYAHQALRITGPEALLPGEQVAVLADVLGRDIAFEAQDDAAARAEMEASMPAAYVEAFFAFFRGGETDETTVLPTVRDVLGREPRSLRAWAAERAADFS